MDILGTFTGTRLFDRDIPKIANSLEQIAQILARLEILLGNQVDNQGDKPE